MRWRRPRRRARRAVAQRRARLRALAPLWAAVPVAHDAPGFAPSTATARARRRRSSEQAEATESTSDHGEAEPGGPREGPTARTSTGTRTPRAATSASTSGAFVAPTDRPFGLLHPTHPAKPPPRDDARTLRRRGIRGQSDRRGARRMPTPGPPSAAELRPSSCSNSGWTTSTAPRRRGACSRLHRREVGHELGDIVRDYMSRKKIRASSFSHVPCRAFASSLPNSSLPASINRASASFFTRGT